MLVVAGPGAGKTFCLIARIARLIAWHGLEPRAHLRRHLHQQGRRRDRGAAPARDRPARRGRHPRHAALALLRAAARPRRRGRPPARVRHRRRGLPAARAPAAPGPARAARPAAPALRPPPAPARAAHRRRPRAVRGLRRGAPRAEPASTTTTSSPAPASCCASTPRRRADVRAPLGLRAGGRVPGPEPGPVRGRDRAGRDATGTASPWATTSSRSSPGPAPTPRSWSRFRDDFGIADADHPRPQPPLLPPDLRGRATAGDPQPRAVREAARGHPRIGALRRRPRLRRRVRARPSWVVARSAPRPACAHDSRVG